MAERGGGGMIPRIIAELGGKASGLLAYGPCIDPLRLKLLAELHWAQPRPLSAAELRFRDQELPELQAAAARMQEGLAVRRPRPAPWTCLCSGA